MPAPRRAPLLVQNGKDRQISRMAHSSLKPGSLGCWLRPQPLHMSLFHPQGAPSIRGVLVRRHRQITNQHHIRPQSWEACLGGWLQPPAPTYVFVPSLCHTQALLARRHRQSSSSAVTQVRTLHLPTQQALQTSSRKHGLQAVCLSVCLSAPLHVLLNHSQGTLTTSNASTRCH